MSTISTSGVYKIAFFPLKFSHINQVFHARRFNLFSISFEKALNLVLSTALSRIFRRKSYLKLIIINICKTCFIFFYDVPTAGFDIVVVAE